MKKKYNQGARVKKIPNREHVRARNLSNTEKMYYVSKIRGPDSMTRCAPESAEARSWEYATHAKIPLLM